MRALRSLLFVTALSAVMPSVALAADRTFAAGSLVIPMDLSYQDRGMFQAYGLIYQLLSRGVHVHWVIDPNKTWHAADCDTPADLCAWDCGIEGSGVKCGYPTASPDMTATTNVIWDDKGMAARDSTLGTHRYRGGPFVIDAADRTAALAVIDAWNDQTKWAANPWANRDVFHVVTVHEATADFTANSAREMIASPTIAVFSDGNEDIATGYLRAAGIPQSSGAEFLAGKCGATNCGPGTANPDMLTEEQIAGDLGLCSAPNNDHKNGALWKPDGTPAFCQIMSMHWGVNEREKVECDGGGCPATQAECGPTEKFTFNGHEVVAEVRAFLAYPTHFFAECQAVNAYENLVPNPAWPYLDDPGRDGHFLTTTGTAPPCNGTCSNGNYDCVADGCGTGMDCCLPTPATWQNMPGFEVATAPTTVKVLSPHVPYNQLDGEFGPVGGSEPAYNLSTFLGSQYKNNRQVTLLTGPNGPGNQDLWMTGYLDGCGDIILGPGGAPRALGCEGKISYLGGHEFKTDVPVASGGDMQGTRLFLNALFEAQCTVAPDSGGGVDTDGDGVDDGGDSDPNDPNKCGDIDGDGCDDCSSGSFNLDTDCAPHGDGNPATGSSEGCCDTRSTGGARHVLLALLVGIFVLRRRRRS